VKPEKVAYRIQRQCSRQWPSLLAALAQECTSQTKPTEPRELMRRIGMRFATQTPLAPCENLEQLQQAMREVWKDMARFVCQRGRDFNWRSTGERRGAVAKCGYGNVSG